MEVLELWRYPVKSLQGEQLAEVEIGLGGLRGDRRFALYDVETGLGLTEPEAFRWIQKTAMDLRKSMREVAEGVIEHGAGGPKKK